MPYTPTYTFSANSAAVAAQVNQNFTDVATLLDGTLPLNELADGTSGQIIVCNSSGVPTYVAMSGDATINNSGAVSLASNSVLASEIGTLPYCELYKSASQSIATTTILAVTFDTEAADTDTMHSTASDTDRINITTAGVYVVGGTVDYAEDIGSDKVVEAFIRDDTGRVIAEDSRTFSDATSPSITLSVPVKLSAGQWIHLATRHFAGSSKDLASGTSGTRLSAHWIGEG